MLLNINIVIVTTEMKTEDGRGSNQFHYSIGRYYKGDNFLLCPPPVYKVCQQAFCKVYQISRNRLQTLQKELKTVSYLFITTKNTTFITVIIAIYKLTSTLLLHDE